jgi:alpha-D-ribose 1-methylphosphonate 5-triphosphate diphosphatase
MGRVHLGGRHLGPGPLWRRDRTIAASVLLPGRGCPPLLDAVVETDADGQVVAAAGRPSSGAARDATGPLVLMPWAVDLHLDVTRARLQPRATVALPPHAVLAALDAECASAGIGIVCLAARFEEEPERGVTVADAVALCAAVEELAPALSCDWRLHLRLELTDPVLDDFAAVLSTNSRVAMASIMDHSVERTRFRTAEAHTDFYSRDWSIPAEVVEDMLRRKAERAAEAGDVRGQAARLVVGHGLPLASHDDRDADDVACARADGVSIAEFPISAEAARAARAAGIRVVLGAPNAVRGQSTAPGNLLVSEAISEGLVDCLCSDYWPMSLLEAPFALAGRGECTLEAANALVSAEPARALGLESPTIREGRPLDAVLVDRSRGFPLAIAMWRSGSLVWCRSGAGRT